MDRIVSEAESKVFRPSNGTEGEMFAARNCDRCKHDNYDAGIYCPLIGNAMAFMTDHPMYPKEWQATNVCDPDTWKCTKFEAKNV